jgi:hypothetical protein
VSTTAAVMADLAIAKADKASVGNNDPLSHGDHLGAPARRHEYVSHEVRIVDGEWSPESRRQGHQSTMRGADE